jgi:hypothetical protein
MDGSYAKSDNGNTSNPENRKNCKKASIANNIFDFTDSPSHRRCNLLHYPSKQSQTKT